MKKKAGRGTHGAKLYLESVRLKTAEICSNPGLSVSLLSQFAGPGSALIPKQRMEADAMTRPLDGSRCLHQMFEVHAKLSPNAVALYHDGRTLTYKELDSRANQVAHYLLSYGVVLESRVGVCIARSPEMIVALLGILKAGAAYVPLDPQYPSNRLAYIVEDADVRIVLSTKQDRQRLTGAPVRILDIESSYGSGLGRPGRLPSPVLPQNLAYVIYTSGSTGRPKGVMVEHQSVANMVEQMIEEFSIVASDRLLQFSSVSWDTSTEEIFPALGSGATLVLRTDAMAESVEAFTDGCRHAGITLINLPTAFWQMIMARDAAALTTSVPSLRLLIIGGERAEKPPLRAWGEANGARVRLFNTYGVTEAASTSTAFELDATRDAGEQWRSVAIGTAIGNVHVKVLDDRMEELPDNVPGELYIGGRGVARGYLDRPQLTAERFVPDPFATTPGARLYRTGDLVQRRPDGVLDCIGRKDKQIKIRGYRIELEEIESILRECKDVLDCAVAVRVNLAGEKVIVGYAVAQGLKQSSFASLRGHLQLKLPAYMVPGVLIWLESLPLTPNGKIDRDALPTPAWRERYHGIVYVAPTTPSEKAITERWSSVLGAAPVGIDDNFFTLGGNSLSATQLISWLWNTYGFRLSLRSIFDYPTVRGLAALMDHEHLSSSLTNGSRAIASVPRDGLLPLTPAEEMMLYMCRRPELSVALNLATAVRLKGNLNHSALTHAFQEITRRHESLRTSFALYEGRAHRVITPEQPCSSEPEQVFLGSATDGGRATAENLATLEASRPFDFSNGPLFRYKVHRFSDDDHLLTITVHHVASDAWSLANLAAELRVLYEASSLGDLSPLAPLPIQYADYAVWRINKLQGEALLRLQDYWRKQLDGVPCQVCVPPDQPDPVDSGPTGRLEFKYSADLTRQVKEQARRQGTTSFVVLLSSLGLLIGKLAKTTDVALRIPVSLRNHAQCEPLIGLFLDMIVMRLDLSSNPGTTELIQRVSRTTRDSLAHQELPFKMLLQSVRGLGSDGREAPFPVTFNFINTPDDRISLSGLDCESVDIHEEPASRSKLHLHMFERDGALRGSMVYQTGFYSEARIRRLVEELQGVLLDTCSNDSSAVTEEALERA